MVYNYHRLKNREQRQRVALRRAGRSGGSGAVSVPDDAVLATLDSVRNTRVGLKAAIRARLTRGYVWDGGLVGGCKRYMRKPLVYQGLVSAEHPILEFFVTKTHKARRLRTGHTKAESLGTDSKLLALDCAYVESVKDVRGVVRCDLDTDWPGLDALRQAILAQGVPLPNICIAHVEPDGRILRPHLLWLLASGVSFSDLASKHAQGAWHAAVRAMLAALIPLGADVGGLDNPHRHKNPLSPLWSRHVMAEVPYVLRAQDHDKAGTRDTAWHQLVSKRARRHHVGVPIPEVPFVALLDHLPDRKTTGAAIRAARLEQKTNPRRVGLDHPDARVGMASNWVWNALNASARALVGTHRDGGGSRLEYDRLLVQAAHEHLGAVDDDQRTTALERLARLAARVGAWTWTNWRANRAEAPTDPATQLTRQQGAHARSCTTKVSGTLDALIEAARRARAGSALPTQARVVELAKRCRRTVQAYWSQVLEALEGGEDASDADSMAGQDVATGEGAFGVPKDKKSGSASGTDHTVGGKNSVQATQSDRVTQPSQGTQPNPGNPPPCEAVEPVYAPLHDHCNPSRTPGQPGTGWECSDGVASDMQALRRDSRTLMPTAPASPALFQAPQSSPCSPPLEASPGQPRDRSMVAMLSMFPTLRGNPGDMDVALLCPKVSTALSMVSPTPHRLPVQARQAMPPVPACLRPCHTVPERRRGKVRPRLPLTD